MFLKHGVVFMYLVISLEAAKCPVRNQVHTGTEGVKWSAFTNGVLESTKAVSQVLYPAGKEMLLFGNGVYIEVRLEEEGAKLALEQVSVETKLVQQLAVEDLGETVEVKEDSPVLWTQTNVTFSNPTVDVLTIKLKSVTRELKIRKVFVKGCALVDWCKWGPWGECSVSCDGGKTKRSRVCNCESTTSNPFVCRGRPTKTKTCNTKACKDPISEELDWRPTDLWDPAGADNIFSQPQTENAVALLNWMPINRGREAVAAVIRDWSSRFPVSSREIVASIQMSEVRVYSIYEMTFFNEDRTQVIRKIRLLVIWLLVNGKWLQDVISITDADI